MKAEIKDRMKEAMLKNNIRSVELCEVTGIPKSAISYYLAGKSKPKSDRLYLIAKALDVSEAWLLGYDVDSARSVEQKELDELAQAFNRTDKDNEFRQLIIKINRLDSDQLNAVRNIIDAFNK